MKTWHIHRYYECAYGTSPPYNPSCPNPKGHLPKEQLCLSKANWKSRYLAISVPLSQASICRFLLFLSNPQHDFLLPDSIWFTRKRFLSQNIFSPVCHSYLQIPQGPAQNRVHLWILERILKQSWGKWLGIPQGWVSRTKSLVNILPCFVLQAKACLQTSNSFKSSTLEKKAPDQKLLRERLLKSPAIPSIPPFSCLFTTSFVWLWERAEQSENWERCYNRGKMPGLHQVWG